MPKKTTRIIFDSSFGFGPTFYIVDAVITEKTIEVMRTKHRKEGHAFAIATLELIKEADAINKEREQLAERGRAFKLKLKQSPQP